MGAMGSIWIRFWLAQAVFIIFTQVSSLSAHGFPDPSTPTESILKELSSPKSDGSVLDLPVLAFRRGVKSQHKTHTKRAGGSDDVAPKEELCGICSTPLSRGGTAEWPGRCQDKFHPACLHHFRRANYNPEQKRQAPCPVCNVAVDEEFHEPCPHCGAAAARSSQWSDVADGYPCVFCKKAIPWR